ncbi:MAG: MYXO-CTERM sorting domain-containing protein, partial [Kofleriaceae bacterium]
APGAAASRAIAWLAADGYQVALRSTANARVAAPERVILPVVRPKLRGAQDITYRLADPVEVDSTTGPGRWVVWLDAGDGAPIARKSEIHYASGRVLYDAPDRHPAGARGGKPAALATHRINGVAVTSALDGAVTWTGASPATVVPGLSGPLVSTRNAAGPLATTTLSLADGGTATWGTPTTETSDAQISAYVFANTAKQFALTRLNPSLPWLSATLEVFTNENDTCNAYSNLDDIHFFRRGSQCENTARLADVVYHEFGHSLHAQSLINGVGGFDGAMSEGMSDVLAALITRDHGMGRGFFFNDQPLRDLDPAVDKVWPDDVTGEVHDDGEIIGGTMWDLGKALEDRLGEAAGYEKTLDIFYGILQRGSDIPSAYAEALLADDDDGNVQNGTPNLCTITEVFAAHGLADPTLAIGVATPVREGFDVSVSAMAGSGACASTLSSATIEWKVRGGTSAQLAMTLNGDKFEGSIPAQPEGTVVQYKVTVMRPDGATVSFPNNPADPFYEFYVGPTTPIWCADFEGGAGEWSTGATPSNSNDWEAGPPRGLGGDPSMAFGGNAVFGNDLMTDGQYRNRSTSFAETPEIDLGGNTHVRLQLQRWLGVEDGFFDNAKILVNGTEVWTNFKSATDPQAGGVNHLDREWRFADFDLSPFAASGKVKVRFQLTSDPGLSFGGWTLDDVCIVAMTGAAVTCGNGSVDQGETCDDGNRVDGDGCSANCIDEDGSGDGGCCSVGTDPTGPLVLMLLTFGVVLRPRRRRA